jgi:hypothetical protein
MELRVFFIFSIIGSMQPFSFFWADREEEAQTNFSSRRMILGGPPLKAPNLISAHQNRKHSASLWSLIGQNSWFFPLLTSLTGNGNSSVTDPMEPISQGIQVRSRASGHCKWMNSRSFKRIIRGFGFQNFNLMLRPALADFLLVAYEWISLLVRWNRHAHVGQHYAHLLSSFLEDWNKTFKNGLNKSKKDENFIWIMFRYRIRFTKL